MAGLSLGLAGQALAAESGCKLGKIAELDVRFDNNRPLVEAEINGQKVIFLLDTGAEISTLSGAAAERLGLRAVPTGGEMMGVGGRRRLNMITLQSLKLADSNIGEFRIGVISGDDFGDPRVVGLLGRDLFGQTEVEFDLGEGKVRLFHAENCPQGQSLAYWTQTPEVAVMDRPARTNLTDPFKVNLTLNNSRVEAILDSGAGVSTITAGAAGAAGARAMPNPDEGKAVVAGIGSAAVETRIVRFDQMILGDETIRGVKLRVGDLFSANAETSLGSRIAVVPDGLPQMLIGADFLRSHRVLISSSQARLYFTYSGGPVFQTVGAAVRAEAPADAKADPVNP